MNTFQAQRGYLRLTPSGWGTVAVVVMAFLGGVFYLRESIVRLDVTLTETARITAEVSKEMRDHVAKDSTPALVERVNELTTDVDNLKQGETSIRPARRKPLQP